MICNRVELIEGSDCSYRISVPAFDGKLSMSRSFGDFFLKQNKQLSVEEQAIIAVPDVIVHTRHKEYVRFATFVTTNQCLLHIMSVRI